MKAGYVRNLVRHPRVRVKLRKGLGAQWRAGTAHVLSDDDPRERQRWLAGQVTGSRVWPVLNAFTICALPVRRCYDSYLWSQISGHRHERTGARLRRIQARYS